tara:strand:+ start:71 stop:301 length:231 start_codon:yes stop_codon:yes gene_type:complete
MGKKKDTRVKQLRDLLDDAISVGDDDQIQILRAELESINPNYKDGGNVSSSAEGSVIPMKMKSGGLAKRGYGKARR